MILKSNYRVLPLPIVERQAKKMLTAMQRHEGIAMAKRLAFYPDTPDLEIEPCGDGFELHIEGTTIDRQGWLRAIFWVHEESRTIYIVDLFWKKTNKIRRADIIRANHRITLLKNAGNPWES